MKTEGRHRVVLVEEMLVAGYALGDAMVEAQKALRKQLRWLGWSARDLRMIFVPVIASFGDPDWATARVIAEQRAAPPCGRNMDER